MPSTLHDANICVTFSGTDGLIHEALQICVVPTMKAFLSHTGIYVAATAICQTSPFAAKKKESSPSVMSFEVDKTIFLRTDFAANI